MSDREVNVSDSLISAVNEGDLKSVADLVTLHGLSHCKDWHKGYVLLCNAIKMGHLKIAQFLLEKGAKVNRETDHINTPLHFAVEGNHAQLVRLLLEKDASVNAQNGQNNTALHLAAKQGYADVVRILLDNNASMILQNNSGSTPLLSAVKHNRLKVFKKLLLASPPKERDSALLNRILLCNSNAYDLVFQFVVQTLTSDDYNKEIIVDNLIDSGFAVSRECVSEPLIRVAIKEKNAKLIESIIACGPNCKYAEYSPLLLHAAVKNQLVEMVRLFLNSGLDVNAEDKKCQTALHLAAEKGSLNCQRILEMLCEKGANVNVRQKDGWTPLHFATCSGSTSIVKILLKFGAEINARGSKGETPLHCAASTYNDIVTILLDSGCDVNAKTSRGATALDVFTVAVKRHFNDYDRGKLLKYLDRFDSDDNFSSSNDDYSDDDARAYFKPDDNDAVVALKRHLIKLTVANLDIDERNDALIYSHHDFPYLDFQDRCEEEVEGMKNEKLNPQFTLYDILADSKNLSYATNKSLMRDLKPFHFDRFPIYKNLIMCYLEKCKAKRKLWKSEEADCPPRKIRRTD